jgi:Sulfatase
MADHDYPTEGIMDTLPKAAFAKWRDSTKPYKTMDRKRTNITCTCAMAVVLALVTGAFAAGAANQPQGHPPNILLIPVDDVGYCDIGAFAGRLQKTSPDKRFYETPRIDRLAAEGAMFTQFYACTVCAPSRATLLTGKMNNRMGLCDAYAEVKNDFRENRQACSRGRPHPRP